MLASNRETKLRKAATMNIALDLPTLVPCRRRRINRVKRAPRPANSPKADH